MIRRVRAASSMSSSASCRRSAGRRGSRKMSWPNAMIAASGLLSSWTMPGTSWPIASIRWAWASSWRSRSGLDNPAATGRRLASRDTSGGRRSVSPLRCSDGAAAPPDDGSGRSTGGILPFAFARRSVTGDQPDVVAERGGASPPRDGPRVRAARGCTDRNRARRGRTLRPLDLRAYGRAGPDGGAASAG